MDEGGGEGGGGHVAMLRQLIGQIQELCNLFGGDSLPLLYNPHRWYFLDAESSLMEDDYCSSIISERSRSVEAMEENQFPPPKKSRLGTSVEKCMIRSSSGVMMEPKIWKQLPEELLEIVIARLPVAAFFRFRSVCQKWNSLLTSNSFIQLCAEVTRCCWFFTLSYENVKVRAMYDPSMRKWHKVSNPYLPDEALFLPVASVGGLICFLDINQRGFHVLNPLTGTIKDLPPKSVKYCSHVVVGMVQNGHSANGGYKVVWIGGDGEFEVYDSVENSLTHLGFVPSSIKLPMLTKFRSTTVSVGSTLYFMRTNPDGIVSYDAATCTWNQFLIPLPAHLVDPFLAECGGKVILVGLLSKNVATCVYIWELQKMTLLWKEVDRMPNEWCLELYGRHVRMMCLGNQGLLMLSLRSGRKNCLVSYDISTKEWQRVPDCVLPYQGKRQLMACGIAFHPCPTALP